MKNKRRKPAQTAASALGGAVLIALGVWRWTQDDKGAAVAMVGIGLLLLAMAAFMLWEVECPSCGKTIDLGHDISFRRCPQCRAYARVRDAGLEKLPDDYASDKPSFAVPIESAGALPAKCCVCAAPATRATALKATMEDPRPLSMKEQAAAGAGLRKTVTAEISVPHCAAHEAEARIGPVNDNDGLRGVFLFVRSYSFYRQALGL